MPDDRTLGQVLHAARIKHNPPKERPANVPPWDERAPWQRALDEAMAADLEAVVRQPVDADFRRLADDLERFAWISLWGAGDLEGGEVGGVAGCRPGGAARADTQKGAATGRTGRHDRP